MRWTTLRLLMLVSFFSFLSIHLFAQRNFNTGLNHTVINLPCNQNCVNIPVKIPHLKSTTDYTISSITYNPFPYVTTGGVELSDLYDDDVFSDLVTLPFAFCFFDSAYNKVVIGSNGIITFDEICKAPADNAYTLTNSSDLAQPLPYNHGSAPGDIDETYYPRASIMGAYHDIFPSLTAGGQRKIEYSIVGTAPFRVFVVSYFSVPMYSCTSQICTEQIAIYESTGMIEVYLGNKPLCSTWEDGRAILGIQNWDRDKAVVAPGKNCTAWSESNTGYRFTPSGGTSHFKSCKVYDLSHNLLAAGDTITTVPGQLDVTFPSFCPPGVTGQYVIETIFTAACDDNVELVSSDTITINKTNSLTATATTTQTSCGANVGTATLTVPAGIGTAPYTFVLTPGNISQNSSTGSTTFNNLAAGSYSVTVTDAGGTCSSTVPVSITSTGVLGVNFTPVATSCNGALNGKIIIDQLQGTAPYNFVLNPGNISQAAPGNYTFSGLAAGTYFVSAYDVGGCKAENIPVTIDPGPSITITMTSTPTSCPGANNGSITVIGCTGTAPFKYSLNAGPYQTSATFSNLAPNTYFITVEDAVGCKANFIPQTVDAGTGTLTGTTAVSGTSCSGASDGSVTITPTTGSGPYEYSINSGSNWQTSNIFSGLAAGSYSVIIREGGLCQSNPIAVNITAGPALTGTATSTSTACTGVNNGSVTVTPGTGFTGPFEYVLDAGSYQASATFTGVSAGPHTVKIRNASGCISGAISVTVAAGSTLTATTSSTSTSCTGATDGTITVTPTNGSGPYQYSIDGGTYQAGATFTSVAAGVHSVKFKDNFGCISPDIQVTVTAGAVLTGTASSTSTACIGVNNGSITVTPGTGFTGPFQYALDGGTFQSSNSFTGVAAGPHNVVIKNASGCTSQQIPVTVAAGTVLTGNAVPTALTCNGAGNGVIIVTPTNGSAPYQYALNGGSYQSSDTFSGLAANSYNVTIKDAFGCVSSPIPVTVDQPAVLAIPAPTVQAVTCNGSSNGTITVNPTGGTAPYSYSRDNIAFQPGNTFTVGAGSYTIYVKDAKGCTAQAPATVTQPAALTAAIASTTNSTCAGGSDGSIQVAANGGTSPYQYSSDGGFTFQASNVLPAKAGTYTVVVKDANNCTYTITPDVAVGLTDNLILSAANPAPICEGTSVQLTATGNGTSYSWAVGNGNSYLTGATTASPTATPPSTTTYTVTARLGSCEKSANVTVTVLPAPIPDAGANGDICFGQNYQLHGSGGVVYSWTPSVYLDDPAQAAPQVVKPSRTTTYTLSVIDANNCHSLVTDMVEVNVVPPIKVYVTPLDTVVYAGAQYQLSATSVATDYTWSSAAGLSNPYIPDPVVTAPLLDGAEVTYKVIASTSAGCQGEGYATVRVFKGPEIYMVNAFTPNHDGKNELFVPIPVGIKQLNYFRVFNRWGQLVFSTNALHRGWDGKWGSIEQPNGIYVWMVQGITDNGILITKKGTVTLIR